MSSTDFEVWLATLPALGYDRLWVTNNRASLLRRFRDNPAPMEPCPEPPAKRMRDRYEEL